MVILMYNLKYVTNIYLCDRDIFVIFHLQSIVYIKQNKD